MLLIQTIRSTKLPIHYGTLSISQLKLVGLTNVSQRSAKFKSKFAGMAVFKLNGYPVFSKSMPILAPLYAPSSLHYVCLRSYTQYSSLNVKNAVNELLYCLYC